MSKKVTDIVIPYKLTQDNGKELKYALRSIEKNCKFPHRVVIVGDCPDWVDTKEVLHMPIVIETNKENPKAWNIIEKIRFITSQNQISDSFVMTYDDIVFSREITMGELSRPVALSKMPESFEFKTDASAAWKTVFINTMKALLRNKMPMYNYETHCPRVFDKQKLADVFERFGFEKRPYCFPSLYFNSYEKQPLLLSEKEDQCIKAGLYSQESFEKLKDNLGEFFFTNWSDTMWSEKLEALLECMFPEPSKFELKIVEGASECSASAGSSTDEG